MCSTIISLNLSRSNLLLFNLLLINAMLQPNHFNNLTPHLNGKILLNMHSSLTLIFSKTLDKISDTTCGLPSSWHALKHLISSWGAQTSKCWSLMAHNSYPWGGHLSSCQRAHNQCHWPPLVPSNCCVLHGPQLLQFAPYPLHQGDCEPGQIHRDGLSWHNPQPYECCHQHFCWGGWFRG